MEILFPIFAVKISIKRTGSSNQRFGKMKMTTLGAAGYLRLVGTGFRLMLPFPISTRVSWDFLASGF